MKSQTECLEALAAGHTLTNGVTFVHLDSYGAQVITGYRSKAHNEGQPYTFDNPQFWYIFKPKKKKDITLLLSVFLVFSLFVNFLQYLIYDSISSELEPLGKVHAELLQAYEEQTTENNYLIKQIEKYETQQKELTNLGATPEQAQTTIRASNLYNLDPKHLAP